jgi:hypothetical protein
MTKDEELKALIEDLRLNHEYCPKEVILQAADELERLQRGVESLYDRYMQVCRQREELLDMQRSMVEAMRGRIQ